MSGPRRIRSEMTPFPHAVDVGAPLAEARRLMERHNIHHLPVKRDDQLVGLVSDRGIRLALGPYVRAADGDHLQVRHVCSFETYSVETSCSLAVVAAEMARRRLDCALITKDGRLAGIFTATDACRCLAELLEEPGDAVA